jgi:hypothetical protein
MRPAAAAGFGAITTEILPAPAFYHAEDYHQQYLAKNPGGYCGIGGTGRDLPGRGSGWPDGPMVRRIHVLGASGAGTSTLARGLASALDSQAFDTDDFYWTPTDPPFTEKRPVAERLALMEALFLPRRDWVLSGSFTSWGAPDRAAPDACRVPDAARGASGSRGCAGASGSRRSRPCADARLAGGAPRVSRLGDGLRRPGLHGPQPRGARTLARRA